MKNLFITAVALLSFATVFGQVYIDGNTGYAKIGDASAATEVLEVAGNILSTGNGLAARLDFDVAGAGSPQLRFAANSSGVSTVKHFGDQAMTLTTAGAENLKFKTGNNTMVIVRGDNSSTDFTTDILVGTTLYSSDARLKNNIQDYDKGLDAVMGLDIVSWEYNGKGYTKAGKKAVGLIAQNLQEVAPEMVKEHDHIISNEDGSDRGFETYLAIKDNEIKYLMINAIQEQEAQIAALEAQLEGLMADSNIDIVATPANTDNNTTTNSTVVELEETGTKAVLGQNVPNPFASSTKIEYFVPVSANTAKVVFTDINGMQIKDIRVATGSGSIDVNVNGLTTGIYSYTLIVDGVAQATKKMIIE